MQNKKLITENIDKELLNELDIKLYSDYLSIGSEISINSIVPIEKGDPNDGTQGK